MRGMGGGEPDVIGAIYDAVIEPHRWDATVDLIRKSLGFQIAILGVSDANTGAPIVQAFGNVPDRFIKSVGDYGAEIMEAWGGPAAIARVPEEEPIHMASFISPASWQNNRYYLEWCCPQGLVDQIGLLIERTPRVMGTLGLGLHESQPPINEAQMDGVRFIAPHLRRAVIISGLLTARAEAATSFEDTLTALGSGVVLFDPTLQIVYANERAQRMIRESDPIASTFGQLSLPGEVVDGQLKRAVEAASNSAALARGAGIPVRLRDGSGMVIHVLPLRTSVARSPRRAVAAVFIAKPDAELDFPLEALSVLYRLRPAETRVLELIAKGLTGPAIAAALGVAPSTVKTHTLRLLDKLGVHSRADVVRLARDACLGVRDVN